MNILLTDDLRREYQALYDSCVIAPEHVAEVDGTVAKIGSRLERYSDVGDQLGIPWYFVGIIHAMEAGLNFRAHLHNGDPLTARTIHVPKGRPKSGHPPFTWEESARDALTFEGFANLPDWSLPWTLYRFEKFNGFGYRSRGIRSPYLWSFSSHYTCGKFAADGAYSPTLVSKQCGAAVLLRRLVDRGIVGAP